MDPSRRPLAPPPPLRGRSASRRRVGWGVGSALPPPTRRVALLRGDLPLKGGGEDRLMTGNQHDPGSPRGGGETAKAATLRWRPRPLWRPQSSADGPSSPDPAS